MAELSLAMKALGFSSDAVKDAMEQGDKDGDGVLNFEARAHWPSPPLPPPASHCTAHRRSSWRSWRERADRAAATVGSGATPSRFR